MKDRDDKFFIPFPEYFANSQMKTHVYAVADFFFDEWPLTATIIFTKSDNFDDIKKAIEEDCKKSEKSRLCLAAKAVIQHYYQKIIQCQPEEPGYKLQFMKGARGRYRFDESNKTLTLCMDSDIFPNPSKAFYFKAGVYEHCDVW